MGQEAGPRIKNKSQNKSLDLFIFWKNYEVPVFFPVFHAPP